MQARLRAFSQLVILLGPPCAGKTTYYQQEYELKGFTRTSLPIDGDEQTVGEILDKLFESLKHKGKVVLDDEQFNTNHDARQGLIDKVKSSIKNIEISVVNIAPTGGKIQCLWASEFAIAEKSIRYDGTRLGQLQQMEDVRCRIDYYYSQKQSVEHQNVDKTETIQQNLFLNRAKYAATSHCALLLPSECILKKGAKNKYTVKDKRSTCHLLTKWNEIYHHSRVIILHNEDKDLNSLRDAMLDLDLTFPVYYQVKRDWTDIAFLQYTHSIDPNRSVIVTPDEKQIPPKQIMRHMEYDILLEIFTQVEQESQQQLASEEDIDIDAMNDYICQQIEERAQKGPDAPEYAFLSNIEYKSVLKSIDLPDVKRYPLVEQLISSDTITDQNYLEQRMCEHVHGIMLHRQYLLNYDVSDDFDEDYAQEGADRIMANMPKHHVSPKPVRKQPTAPEPKEEKVTPEKKVTRASPSSSASTKCKITMTIADIVKHFGVVYFQRGRDYYRDHRIDKFKTKEINSVAFKLYTLCQGSLEEPYKEESLFKDGRILKALCTCPVGGDGLCKHVCAQLLSYLDKENYIASKNGKIIPQQPEQIVNFESLDPISENWCIRCKVIKKSAVRNWSNERGSGVVASVLVRDESVNPGTVNHLRLVFFNEALDEFFDKMQPNKLYNISKAHLYVASPNHKEDKNMKAPYGSESEFEIHLKERVSKVIEVVAPTEKGDIKQVFENRVQQQGGENIEFVPFGATPEPVEEKPKREEKPKTPEKLVKESPKRKREELDDDDDVEEAFFPGMKKRSPKKKLRSSLDTTEVDQVIHIEPTFDQIMNEMGGSENVTTIIDDDDDDQVMELDAMPKKREKPLTPPAPIVVETELEPVIPKANNLLADLHKERATRQATPRKEVVAETKPVETVKEFTKPVEKAPVVIEKPVEQVSTQKTPKKMSLKDLIAQSNKS